jgi:hypothetical protein
VFDRGDVPARAPARRWRRPAAVLGELAPVG